jgi:hypothetical protein
MPNPKALPDSPAMTDSEESFTSTTAELRRIDFTGTIWFAAAIVATAVPLGSLLAANWRPSELPPPLGALWWIGAALTLVGTAALAWAGCPVLGFTPEEADRQKSLCVRAGVALYLGGTVIAALSLIASPAPLG